MEGVYCELKNISHLSPQAGSNMYYDLATAHPREPFQVDDPVTDHHFLECTNPGTGEISKESGSVVR